MVSVTADRSEELMCRGGACILADSGSDQPGATVHLEPTQIDARGEQGPVAPKAAETLAVLQRGGARETGLVEREISVAGHPIEKRGMAELRLVEAGHAVELGAGEAAAALKTHFVEAGIAEKLYSRKIGWRIERAVGEPGKPLKEWAAQRDRRVERGAGKVHVGQRRIVEFERRVDDRAAQIFDLSLAQGMSQLFENPIHALPAAPAGGPAKDSANGPIATMST